MRVSQLLAQCLLYSYKISFPQSCQKRTLSDAARSHGRGDQETFVNDVINHYGIHEPKDTTHVLYQKGT
jgi:hypothetical protein